MKKVAAMMKFDKSGFDDVSTFLHQHAKNVSQSYDEVLRMAVEQYLDRPFVAETDANRIYLNVYQDSNQTDIYIDDSLIGSISTVMDYNNDDFIKNKISFIISFKPSINALTEDKK